MKQLHITTAQYTALMTLYHEFNEAFILLPVPIKQAFYDRLVS